MRPGFLMPAVRLWRRLTFRWRRDRLEQELAEELEFHRLQLEAEDGAACSRRMGNMALAREECRDMWGFVRVERLFQDIRYASRIFRKAPGFTAVAVCSLALGIGGNAAMFSLVNTLLIRPLPYSEPDRLFRITSIYPRAAVPFFQERSRTMDVAAVSTESEFNLAGRGRAIRVFGSVVSANLFSVLGAAPAGGCAFASDQDSPGRDAVVILSDSLWRTEFLGDPAAIGQIVSLNGTNRRIVGVMPPGFSYPSSKAQLWIPMRLDPSNFLEFWGGNFVTLVARLRPGIAPERARGEVHSLAVQFLKTFPYPMPRDFNLNSTAITLQQDLTGDIRGKLTILLCSVGIVLLIACTNVAGLLLSRATARRKEIALRTALGAGRLRIVRQLLTESTVLALVGGGLGIAVGAGALSLFKAVLPLSTPGLQQAAIDLPVATAVAALALLTGLTFGLAPALSASQIDLADAMKTGSARSTGVRWKRLRSWLVGAEVALTLVLAIGAGLLIRSLYTLSDAKPGFEAANILTVRISPNQSYCTERTACIALYERLLARARGIPGIAEAAIANALPLEGAQPTLAVDVEGHPKSADFPAPLLWSGTISPGYLRMMRIPLLSGRNITEADGTQAAHVILISASTARHFWPGENAIGKHIKGTGETAWRTVVGVVGDVHQFNLGKSFPDFIPGAIYMPYAQSARQDGAIPAAMTLMVKTRADSELIRRQLQALAQDQDPNIPVGRITALADVAAGSIADFRYTIRVFLSFAVTAILLAAIGIYGLVSYWASQRTFEIGVRVAIGATRSRIVSMILGQGLRVALCGAAVGLVAALALTRFLATLLFGVAATDPLTFAAVAAIVLTVAAAATALPAWRASRQDPTRSLRAE